MHSLSWCLYTLKHVVFCAARMMNVSAEDIYPLSNSSKGFLRVMGTGEFSEGQHTFMAFLSGCIYATHRK